jgi:deoxyribonuclease IV
MRFGVHVGISAGLVKAAEFALDSTCDCLQIFSSNPTGWRPSPLDERGAAGFAQVAAARDLRPVFLHTPYLINLATSRPDFHAKSILLLENALSKAGRFAALGVPGPAYVVTHVGSHQGLGAEEGCRRIAEGIAPLLQSAAPGACLLIENSPGSGTELAHTFEEYAMIFAPLEHFRNTLGVTLDTAHLWGAGYDISTAAGVHETLDAFDRQVGLDRLKLIHANDSIYGLASRNDEHVHPGTGKIGIECFRALVSDPRLAHVCFVQELPGASAEENRQLLGVLRDMVPRQPEA